MPSRERYIASVAKTKRNKPGLFPALLKYWRGASGISQLDLALSADVSARHVSFMETGRAQPSREMVLRLGAALCVPLRDQNAMLHAAGFEDAFSEPRLDGELTGPVAQAVERMLAQQEPFPMVVMDRHYNVLRTNAAATALLGHFVLEPAALGESINAFRMLFDPRLARPFVVDWERCARGLLANLHREALQHPGDRGLSELVAALLEYPEVPEAWRQPDFSQPNAATFTVRFKRDALDMAFLTTVTTFNAPRNVTLEELRIESYFPLDEATERACRELVTT